ncbi:hypothetical protein [Chitinophaga pinensis]|nr:hypothetical protein [Chitinophaga pinensis]
MKTHYIFNAGLVLSISLASVLSAYAQPKNTSDLSVVQTGTFRNDIGGNAEKSIAALPWRQFLANKELEALIDTALAKIMISLLPSRILRSRMSGLKKQKAAYYLKWA